MSSLIQHVEAELEHVPDDVATPRMKAAIVELAAATVDTYDSGGSAPYGAAIAADLFRRAFLYEPLTPLTGDDDEWIPIDADTFGEAGVCQNRRDGRIFRYADGSAYALDQVVWTDKFRGGPGYTGWDSARRITFPWTPTEPRRCWRRLRYVDRMVARLRGQLRTA
jgi:hypothetical protein